MYCYLDQKALPGAHVTRYETYCGRSEVLGLNRSRPLMKESAMPTLPESVNEIAVNKAPAARPQPITFHDGKLWLGCIGTPRLFAIDVKTWSVVDEVELPGEPYGIASFDGALHVVLSIGEDDDRYIYRFTPGTNLNDGMRTACPDLTGSHLASDGKALYLVQQSKRRMLKLAANGTATREIPMSTRCAGAAFRAETCYLITADDEFDVLELATLDLHESNAEPVLLAPMHLEARGLAFDGKSWWTSYRELGDIVTFTL